MQPYESGDSITPMDRRATDKWHVDRTINLPNLVVWVGAILTGAITATTWGNRVDNDITREREARMRIETQINEQRTATTQMRTELSQQQTQLRIELQQQISEVKSDVNKGLDKIETKLERGMIELRNDIKILTNK